MEPDELLAPSKQFVRLHAIWCFALGGHFSANEGFDTHGSDSSFS